MVLDELSPSLIVYSKGEREVLTSLSDLFCITKTSKYHRNPVREVNRYVWSLQEDEQEG